MHISPRTVRYAANCKNNAIYLVGEKRVGLGEAKDDSGFPNNSSIRGGAKSTVGRDRCVNNARLDKQRDVLPKLIVRRGDDI